jgi:serine/threonine-protein kinase
MARRNLRAGRVDKRGALRLAATLFVLILTMWILGAHHVASFEDEFGLFAIGLANAAIVAGTFWLVYLSIEPFARRHWPAMLVTWTRMIAGGWRDPMVGRDLLVGAAAGSLITILSGPLRRLIPVWLGQPPPPPRGFLDLTSVPKTIAWLLSAPGVAITWVFALLMFLVLVRRLVRRQWIAAVIVTAIFSLGFLGLPNPELTLPLGALVTGGLVVIAIRFGLLAALVCEATRRALDFFVTTPDPSAWYFYPGALAIAAVLAVATWGYLTTKAPSAAPAQV